MDVFMDNKKYRIKKKTSVMGKPSVIADFEHKGKWFPVKNYTIKSKLAKKLKKKK